MIAQRITGPLHLRDTMFNPPASLKPRIAAEEYQPSTGRGIVWGSVHDENAYCVGGVSGHAGVFSTAHDLGVLAQTLLDGGRYGHTRILDEDSVRLLFTNFNQAFPSDSHGLGFELDQRWYMDALNSPVTAGHTGFTGTSHRDRPAVEVVRHPADEPGAPEPQLGQQQPVAAGGGPGPGTRAAGASGGGQYRLVLRDR